MQALARLSVKVAHDINNVLGAIEGFATLAGRSAPPGSQLLADMDEVRAAVAEGAAFTRRLAGFGGKLALATAPCRPSELLEAEAARFRAAGGPWAVVVRCGADLPGLQADAALLGKALRRLLRNAAEAMPRGGRITLAAARAAAEPPGGGPPRGWVRLSVSDEGKGITDEALDRAFEPFYTSKHSVKGVGMGLPVVYAIASRHGGWAEGGRLPGAGSEFSLYLPLEAPPGRPR
jgi:signal transduction histidine kinase